MENILWMWFVSIFGQGSRRAAELSQHITPADIFGKPEHELMLMNRFTPKEISVILKTDISGAHKEYEKCLKTGIRVVSIADEEYPENLRNIYAPPLVLYVRGELECTPGLPVIAAVGSRRMTAYGKKISEEIIGELAASGIPIVSGMASGVDQACHAAALKNGGKTLAVLGCGHANDYPKNSAELKDLVAKNGAVISEYPPDYPALPHNFPVRNRIISGLSHGVIVVEADEHSGSLITVGHALSQGRDVFAVPGRTDDPQSAGTNKLIKQGAKLITRASEVAEEYIHLFPELEEVLGRMTGQRPSRNEIFAPETPVPTAPAAKPDRRKPAPEYFTEIQLSVYRALDHAPLYPGEIAEKAGLELSRVLGALIELEIYGFAKMHTGKRYSL